MSATEPSLDLLEPPARPLGSSRRPFLLGVLAGCGLSLLLLALGAGIAMVAAGALGALMESGRVPDTAAVPGETLPDATLDFLVEAGIVDPDEQVLYFYSGGFLSLREDGNLFTDRRVISYWEDEDELLLEEATYPEIADISASYAEGRLPVTQVAIERADGGGFTLMVSEEGGHDRRFVERLIETWELAR